MEVQSLFSTLDLLDYFHNVTHKRINLQFGLEGAIHQEKNKKQNKKRPQL